MTQSENQDTRIGILNTLLKTPHRDLTGSFAVHENMIKQDPRFYGHLAAWYMGTGEVRDHKELFIINLCLSDYEGHRDAGLAMLRELPPYQVARVVDFIHGKRQKVVIEEGRGRAKKKTTLTDKVGLFKRVPRSMQTEIERYLREREADDQWFDSSVLSARKYLKRMYSLFHIKPCERAQKILFDGEPPEESSLFALKHLRKAGSATDQARIIMEHKIPYRLASTVIDSMTPTVILALIEVMSGQELINNLGSLKRRGAFNNPELKKVISEKLEKAKKGKRVSALKSVEAVKAAGLDQETQKQLMDVADSKLKAKGRITKPTALLIDKSQSMEQGIEVGKQMAAMISAIMDADLFVYATDEMPYYLEAKGKDLDAWTTAFKGIKADCATCLGAPLVQMAKKGQRVEQIMYITDEGENRSPAFYKSLQEYSAALGIELPYVFILRAGSRASWGNITGILQRAGVSHDTYEFDGDYYSLPNLIPYLTQGSKLDLLMEIMDVPLPVRKQPQEVAAVA